MSVMTWAELGVKHDSWSTRRTRLTKVGPAVGQLRAIRGVSKAVERPLQPGVWLESAGIVGVSLIDGPWRWR
jgi:hypothetical protein